MSAAPYRLDQGGRIDRGSPLSFQLDGKTIPGFKGDTLASAMFASGLTLVGRSFKYHRPRGLLSAGIEEPNALLTLGEGGRREPNIPATVTELVDGIVARRQNGWPSVEFDLMAMNSLAAPLFSAGFYYKTFMGPARKSWMFYEPFIRRAAGLGQAGYERDPDRYDTRHEFCDVLVVGSGPAGLAAAIAAGRSGARVVLAEQDIELGGSLLLEALDSPAEAWRKARLAELEALANVQIYRRTTAQGLYDGSTVTLIERRDHRRPDPAKGEARQIVTTLRPKAIVFATGAIERPLVFGNNDRPGVMLASAVRTYLNRYAIAPGKRAVVVTDNDSAYRTAFDLAERGVAVTVADLRSQTHDGIATACSQAGIEILRGMAVGEVVGNRGVNEVELTPLSTGSSQRRSCDVLCISGGWSPAVHLTSHTGIKPVYRADIAAFVPGGFAPNHVAAGAIAGEFSTAGAIRDGAAAGRKAASASGHEVPSDDVPSLTIAGESFAIEPVWQAAQKSKGK
ncbi:MAG TPA: 2Fe-2S iron-sulfur cluster-binding protein, partial [Dongiaceae bacterium]|nr:2Fe-2S iron-sulfur cluster-binding protein [Dongiaceae bacterium]